MESFVRKLAGQYFEICPVCDYIREYCKDYIVTIGCRKTSSNSGRYEKRDNRSDNTNQEAGYFRIAISQSDIDFEREKSEREDIKEGIPIRHFPMPTWRHLQSIARLQTTSYLAIPCFFMARSLL